MEEKYRSGWHNNKKRKTTEIGPEKKKRDSEEKVVNGSKFSFKRQERSLEVRTATLRKMSI